MKLKLLIFIVALQCAWILGTTFQQERALRVGKVIMLETAPVDPRDLLRGDYVILSYQISSVPRNLFAPPVTAELPHGTKVFVALRPGGGQFHIVSRASPHEFSAAADEVLLVGEVGGRRWNTRDSIPVLYGLERYYVAEGTGNPTGKLTVQAAVPASGRATIKQVFVDGRPYAEAMEKAAR